MVAVGSYRRRTWFPWHFTPSSPTLLPMLGEGVGWRGRLSGFFRSSGILSSTGWDDGGPRRAGEGTAQAAVLLAVPPCR